MRPQLYNDVNTTQNVDETRSLTCHKSEDVNRASSSLSTHVTSEQVARQIKTATNP